MPITDTHVATLRALLAGDYEQHQRLHDALDRDADREGYLALVAGGFLDAVDRRFGEHSTDADVIQFVGEVRARAEAAGQDLDPVVAERMIRNALGEGSIADLSDQEVISTQLLLLGILVAAEQLSADDLEKVLQDARELGEHLLGSGGSS